MRTVPDSSVPASSWEMDRGRGAAGNRTRVWPAVNHCLPSRAYPTLDAHPWTGAFGEPARLVDDVHVLAGRIHRPTVRPVRFKVFRFWPVNRQWGQNRVSRREGETGRRNGVGVRSCGKVDDGCPCRPPARSKWSPAGHRKPVSPVIWVERREHQPSNPYLHCRHLAGVAFGPRSCPHAHAGMSRLGQECFRSSVFKSRRRPSVRWHATVCVPGRGDPLCGPCMHSGRAVCIRMHQGMHTSFLSVSACFRRSGDGPGACMHCMHHSLIEDSRKREEAPYIDAYNAYKRKELYFFLYL